MRCRPTAAHLSPTTAAQSGLADGSYQFRAVVTDPAGNNSTSNAIRVVVDNTAPAAGTLTFLNLTDTGSNDTPDITQDGTFDLSLAGNSDANGTVVAYEVSTDGGATWSPTTASAVGPCRRQLPVPRGGHRPGRQQLDQQRDRVVIDNTAPTAGTLSFTNLTDTGSTTRRTSPRTARSISA